MTSESKGKIEILKAAADISDWGYGRWAYERWEIFNEQYWDGSLEPGGIFWGLIPLLLFPGKNHDFRRGEAFLP